MFLTFRLAGSVPKATVKYYKAKKEWLDNELKRARKMSQGSVAAELKHCLDRVEKFNREWFVKFEEILHQAKTGPVWDER